jgi:FkbM family methyltransferase
MKKIGIDVGAWIGDTLPLFNNFDYVYAFEPNKFAFQRLKESFSNNPKYKLLNTAISNVTGRQNFNAMEIEGLSSLLEYDKDGEFAKEIQRRANSNSTSNIVESYEIDTIRLDDFLNTEKIERVEYLKIDAQGCDLLVIDSLGERINDVSIIECEVQIKQLYKNQLLIDDVLGYMKNTNFDIISNSFNENPLNQGWENKLVFKNKRYD